MTKAADKKLDKIRKNLLKAIKAAMEVHEELIPDHDKYEAYLEEMVPSTSGFTVDKDKLQDFRSVLYFMLVGTFGVDGSDGKSQPNVQAKLTDRSYSPGNYFYDIPYSYDISDNDSRAWSEILRKASFNARAAQEEQSRITGIIERNLLARASAAERRSRAKGCPNTECSKGLVKVSWKAGQAYQENMPEFHKKVYRDERLPSGKILCSTCQVETILDKIVEATS